MEKQSTNRSSIPTLTLKDWEASRQRQKLGLNDVPLTAAEAFDEKIGIWHHGKNRTFKNLATNIYEGRELERNDSNDRISLKEAEDVLLSLRSYMNTTAKAVDEADTKPRHPLIAKSENPIPESISVTDIKRLKEKRLTAARMAAVEAAAVIETEAAKYRAKPASPELNKLETSSPQINVELSHQRPKSAPSLRRSLEMEGNLLNSVRRHNATRLKLKPTDPFVSPQLLSEFKNPPDQYDGTNDAFEDTTESTALIRLASRTQDERFDHSARSHANVHHDTLDIAIDKATNQDKNKGNGSELHSNQLMKPKVNIIRFTRTQENWLETVQSKRNELKREIESAEQEKFRMVPDIKLTADSWEKAKKEHLLQAERHGKLDEKFQEAKILKLEHKNHMMKRAIDNSKTIKKQGVVAAVPESKKQAKRRKSKPKISSIDDENSFDEYLNTGRHDPDSLTIPFEMGIGFSEGNRSQSRRLIKKTQTPRGTYRSTPALPALDSLDLIATDGLKLAPGRKVQTARTSSRRINDASAQVANLGAMAALGRDIILDGKSTIGTESDRAWLDSIMRTRRDHQKQKEDQFDLEIATAFDSTIVAYHQHNQPRGGVVPGLKTNVSASHASKLSNSKVVAIAEPHSVEPPQVPWPTDADASRQKAFSVLNASIADESEDDGDFLYVSDTDDDSIVIVAGDKGQRNIPIPITGLPQVPESSNSDKLDVLIGDLDSLRGALERRISEVKVPVTIPLPASMSYNSNDSLHSIAARILSAPELASKSDEQLLLSIQPSEVKAISPMRSNVAFNAATSSANEPLRIEIPPSTGHNVTNVTLNEKGIPNDRLAIRPLTSSCNERSAVMVALQKEENSLLDGVEIKNDPLTELLLNRANTTTIGRANPRPLQRPRTSQLQLVSERQIQQQQRELELVTPLTRFFDSSSTADKGRFRLHDARDFVADSIFRKADLLNENVTLLCGTRKDTGQQEVITALFDRIEFSEAKARAWWLENRDRIIF